MLEEGADIESKDRYSNNLQYGWTPLIHGIFLIIYSTLIIYYFLFIASKNGHIEVAKLLLERGADIESKDRWGKTPLIEGIFLKYLFNLNYLSFLFIASRYGHIGVVKLLIEKGAMINSNDGGIALRDGIFFNYIQSISSIT